MIPPDPSVGSSDQPEQLPLRTNIIWSSTGSLTKTMCNWLITIAAVRLSSGFDTAGVLALAMSISNLVVPIAEYRLRTVQVTDVRGEHTARQYLGMRVLSSAAAMIIGAVYTLVTSKLSLFLVITVYCASQVIATFLEGFHATEQRHMRMDYIGISYLLQGGGGLIAFIVGIYGELIDSIKRIGSPASLRLLFTFRLGAFWQAINGNFLLAIVLYAVLGMAGLQEPAPVLATPPAGTAAASAGIQEGERVLTVDGHAVQSFSEMRLKMIDPIVERRPVVLEVEGPDGRHHRSIPTSGLPAGELERDFTRTLGVDLKAGLVQVASVEEGSAAARAGLQLGDQVLRVNGQPISRAQQLIQQVQASDDTKPLQLLVRRGNGEITVKVNVTVDKASASAIEKIKAAGGSVTVK